LLLLGEKLSRCDHAAAFVNLGAGLSRLSHRSLMLARAKPLSHVNPALIPAARKVPPLDHPTNDSALTIAAAISAGFGIL
jgi:hypothetical protein